MFPLEQGAFEMLLIGAIALIVVGPKDLPMLMRKVGQFTAKMRGLAAEFRASFDEMARQSELDDLRREVEALRTGASSATQDSAAHGSGYDPAVYSGYTPPAADPYGPPPVAHAALAETSEPASSAFEGASGDQTPALPALEDHHNRGPDRSPDTAAVAAPDAHPVLADDEVVATPPAARVRRKAAATETGDQAARSTVRKRRNAAPATPGDEREG